MIKKDYGGNQEVHSFSSVICPCVDTANLRLSLG